MQMFQCLSLSIQGEDTCKHLLCILRYVHWCTPMSKWRQPSVQCLHPLHRCCRLARLAAALSCKIFCLSVWVSASHGLPSHQYHYCYYHANKIYTLGKYENTKLDLERVHTPEKILDIFWRLGGPGWRFIKVIYNLVFPPDCREYTSTRPFHHLTPDICTYHIIPRSGYL